MSIERRIETLEIKSRIGGKGYNSEPLYVPLLDENGNWDPNSPFPKETVKESIKLLKQAGVVITGGQARIIGGI